MLTIRLQRMGKKKSPTYRLVVSENARDTQAKSLEILGHYNPTQEPKIIELKTERIKHYLSYGAQMSSTVHNLLVNAGIVESKKKMKSVSITNKRNAKIAEKQTEKEIKKQEAEEAKKAIAEAEKVAKASTQGGLTSGEEAEKVVVETPAEEPKEEVVSVAEEVPAEEKKD